MLPKIVFIVVCTVFALCHGSDVQNSVKTSPVSFFRSQDGSTRFSPPRSRNLGSDVATTSAPIITSTRKTTTIDDTDYFDDNFQPYKIDKRDFFDWRLLEEVFTKQKTNVVISPFSVKIVLAILYEAADGTSNTKRELVSVFYGGPSTFKLREEYHEMLQSLKATSTKYTLNIATKMYTRDNIIPRQQYQKTLEDKYDTQIQCLNFADALEAAETINKWCSNVTEGHLQNLVSSDNIQNANILLINAIFFDGKWRSPFTESFESIFFRQPKEQIRANYIQVTDKFYYFHSTMWNAKVLRLPYQGNKFSMTIILPGAKAGIEELVREIEGDALRRIQWLMTEQKVKVILPKFKFDYTAQLKETLMALGINEIFTDGAQLSGISKGNSLVRQMKVTDVIQKAGIEVHETGTTAFAATDVEIVNKFGGDDTEEFNVNRPFIFIINDEATSNMIFAGKVLDPTV